jgi:hypothetical protein
LTRARQSSLRIRGRKPSDGGAHESASRLGKPGEPGGTSTGVGLDGRSAARRVSPLPQGRERDASEQEGGRGLRPSENRRVRVWLPARRVQLQKSVSDGWSRISSANALQKERPGSSERGPSSSRSPAGETAGGYVERKERRESDSPVKTGEDRHEAQGGERSSSSGPTIAQVVCGSRDRGCNDHRILRRVLTDGRHPGSSRGVLVHAECSRVVLAGTASSDPYQPPKRRRTANTQPSGSRGRRRMNNEGARDRGVRGSIASTPWDQNAHAHDSTVRQGS